MRIVIDLEAGPGEALAALPAYIRADGADAVELAGLLNQLVRVLQAPTGSMPEVTAAHLK